MIMSGFVIAGPSGLIAWSENQKLLEHKQQKLVHLTQERDRLRNRVDLLDQRNADPDLVGELLRSNLNVARPDEKVMLLSDK